MRQAAIVAAALALAATAGCGLVGETQGQLRTAVDARRDQLGACYRELARREPRATGSMRLTVFVRHEQWHVTSTEVVWTELHDERFLTCVSRVLRRIELDDAPTSNLSVEYTFAFEQGVPTPPDEMGP